MKRIHLLLVICLSATLFSPSSQAGCWPWNKCFYDGAFDFFREMADSAASIGSAAVHGDIDGVSKGVINQLTNAGPFRDAMFGLVVDITPGQVGQYVRAANDLRAKVDQEVGGMRAQTYQSMYGTYKNDASTLAAKLKDGNLDFSEYYRYSFHYAVATSDWSNPDAIKASATRIAEDQYAAYSWYNAHKTQGAAIGTIRNRVGLTDDAIRTGIADLAAEMKANKELGKLAPVILAQFAVVATAARNEVQGTTRSACAGVFTDAANIEYCVQRCLPGLNSPDGIVRCAQSTPPIVNACAGKYVDPANQSVCKTRCTHAKTARDIDFCSSAAAPVINACRGSFSDEGNQSVCIKRCFAGDASTCVSETSPIIQACNKLFTAQTNINYCKDHCATAPVNKREQCASHAAGMINSGRREPFVP